MDIKLKNSRWYSAKIKGVVGILFFFSLLTIYLTGVVFFHISRHWDLEIIDTPTYYETELFNQRFYNLLDNVIEVNVHYKSEENVARGDSVTRENLISSFKNYYSIRDGIITQSTQINDTYDGLIILGEIPPELRDNFLEYKSLVEERLPQYRKIYIQNQLADFRAQERELEEYNNFLYCIEEPNGGKVAGNASVDIIVNMDRTIVFEGSYSSNHLKVYLDYANEYLDESGYKLYAAIRDPLLPGDLFFQEGEEFKMVKETLPILFCLGGIASIVAICCLVYLVVVAGQSERDGVVVLTGVDKIYNDIHFLMVAVAGIVSMAFAYVISGRIYYRSFGADIYQKTGFQSLDFGSYAFFILLGVLLITDAAIFLSFILSMSRQVKKHQLFRNTFIASMIRKIGSLFSGKTFQGWIVFILLGYGAVNCILVTFFLIAAYKGAGGAAFLFLTFIAGFNIVAVFLCVRSLNSLTAIMNSAKETSRGNLGYSLDITHISPSFINFALDIENIQNGLKKAVEEAVRGERMKAELITNVSHDLKTPLTSIITYVDLLTKEKLDNPTAAHYVGVLYEKSYRLKQLIEDLIEASKASSGNLTVTKGKVDLRQLVMQAIGEMEEKIEKAGLIIKLTCEEETIIYADGRHMWRIAENLISNVIKYSMPNSRVYIDILHTQNIGLLIIKNISESPIEVNAAHLTERFTRGDESRTTEGSGLGLSIAKSLSEIQGGQFDIHIDGDLFKAIVRMPLWNEKDTEA
ncbi:MAG: HAMP domain-containing histidine kinase [Epulopiscium sp.]|nr:HAMP domain-containing histidine kinase [Candidatus Epulonipiscium sp.]